MNFDYIIYPANIYSVIAAKFLSEKGNVLLLNRFGFMGGDITSALNLVQEKPVNNSSLTQKIFQSIPKDEILFQDEISIIINPEYYKIALQELFETTDARSLFHIRVTNLIKLGNKFELSVAAKEGIINLTAKHVYDFSETQELTNFLFNRNRIFSSQHINFITTKLNRSEILNSFDVSESKKLKDGRYFFSIKLDKNRIDEISAQLAFNNISDKLWTEKCRIQLLPSESLVIYDFANENIEKGFYNFSTFKIDSSPNKRLLSAEKIEEEIGQKKYL